MTLRVLSLGAGVQSSALLMMATKGMIERYDFAVFADTGWEPSEVYRWLSRLDGLTDTPIVRVSSGINIFTDLMRYQESHGTAGKWFSLPFHLRNPRTGNPRGVGRRQCTERLKIRPINNWLRETLGYPGRKRIPPSSVEISLGFSSDEAHRATESTRLWQSFSFPLLDLGYSRDDCIRWMLDEYGMAPPKSACIGCPFRSPAEWLRVMDSPDEWDEALRFDAAIRSHHMMDFDQYLHRERVPLADAVRRSIETGVIDDVRSGIC